MLKFSGLVLFFALLICAGCGSETVTVGPAVAPDRELPQASQRPSCPTLDREVSRYVPAGFCIYGAADNLSAAACGALRADRRFASTMSSSLTTGFALVVTSLTDLAIKADLIKTSILELCEKGGALAMAPGDDNRNALFLVVVKTTGKVEKFFGPVLKGSLSAEMTRPCRYGQSVYLLGRGAVMHVLKIDDVFLIAANEAILAAALAARDGKVPLMAGSPLVSAVRRRLQKHSLAFLAADVQAVLGSSPSYPSEQGAVIKFKARAVPLFSKFKLSKRIKALGLELLEADNGLVVQAKLLLKQDTPQPEGFHFLKGPRVVGESVPVYLGLNIDVSGFFAGPAREAVSGVAAVDRFLASFSERWGLSWQRHVSPWLGSELSAFVIWELKYPQFALLLETTDSKKSIESMLELRDELEKRGQVFASRMVSGHRVFYTRYQGADPSEFEPSIAVTPGFVIITSGRRAIESILEEREKIEGTRGMNKLVSYFGANLQYSLLFSSRILDRLIEPGGRKLELLTAKNHGRCNKNLADIEAGRALPSMLRCPCGGTYSGGSGRPARCSVHGSIKNPLAPRAALEAKLAVVREFRHKYSDICVGAGFTDKDLFQVTLLLEADSTH